MLTFKRVEISNQELRDIITEWLTAHGVIGEHDEMVDDGNVREFPTGYYNPIIDADLDATYQFDFGPERR